MTRAPANLMAVRSLLLDHLNVDKGRTRDVDLEPAEVGIVGDPNHRGGYHCGSDRVVRNDYSVVESPRDRAGLTDDAAALDVGQFRVMARGKAYDLRHFSVWCVGQCAANAPDTRDIREIIYSPDGKRVKRFDRLRRRSSGDDSHLFHTHFSFFRDAIKAGRDLTPLFRRYLTTIGLIEGDDDMTPEQASKLHAIYQAIFYGGSSCGATVPAQYRVAGSKSHGNAVVDKLNLFGAQLGGLAGKDFTDEPAIVAGVLAGLTPEKIAEAIPPTMARQVVDELTRRLAS